MRISQHQHTEATRARLTAVTPSHWLAAVTFTLGFSLSAQAQTPMPSPGRYIPIGQVLCDNQTQPNFTPFVKEQDGEFVEAGATAPSFWLANSASGPALAAGAKVSITHWTCPPNGESVLVQTRLHYFTLYGFSSKDTSYQDFKRLGSFETSRLDPDQLYVPRELIPNISDIETFYNDDRIDGAIEKFRHIGPRAQLDISVYPTSPSSFDMVFPKACPGQETALRLRYERSTPAS